MSDTVYTLIIGYYMALLIMALYIGIKDKRPRKK